MSHDTFDLYDASDFDPFAAIGDDPYPWYAGLHRGPRALHLDQWDAWVLSRYDDVRDGLRDSARLSSAEGVTNVRAPVPMMLTTDPPDHERLRRIVGREFAPRDIHRFRPIIERFVEEGLDQIASEGTDLVAALAVPVPIRLMGVILGVPDSDIARLRRMADDLVQGLAIRPRRSISNKEAVAGFDFPRIIRGIASIRTFFDALIDERRRSPADDLVTKLGRPGAEGSLTPDEVLWFCLLLLLAGIETTTNLIGNMVLAFHEHPDQWQALRARPELLDSAVNESLRYDSPIQGFFRTALDTYTVDGVDIPAGARVLLLFAAANHDPTHFDDPDAFRIDRNPTDHLAFGAGIHRCLGSGLAELEGRIVLEGLLRRAETLEIEGDVVRRANMTLRGAAKVPLRLAVT